MTPHLQQPVLDQQQRGHGRGAVLRGRVADRRHGHPEGGGVGGVARQLQQVVGEGAAQRQNPAWECVWGGGGGG
jgi:hypothetical protein